MTFPKTVCLFIGRFQPFHNGHLSVLKGMVKVCDKVVVGVGSATAGSTAENPFTARERREMIQRALQAEDIIPRFDIELVDMPDETDDAAWANACLARGGGSAASVWTGNAWTKKCFAAAGAKIQDIREVPGISATEIRRRMLADEAWETLVPKDVADFIREIEGAQRVKTLARHTVSSP
jgi:nicotinamide-nucleotide adenylyltransferase